LGGCIALAIGAPVFGVATANLVYLPIGTKLKRKIALAVDRKIVVLEGVLAIQEGLNPRVLEEKLRAYTGEVASAPQPDARKKAA
jgi:chemotaxis protein MotA